MVQVEPDAHRGGDAEPEGEQFVGAVEGSVVDDRVVVDPDVGRVADVHAAAECQPFDRRGDTAPGDLVAGDRQLVDVADGLAGEQRRADSLARHRVDPVVDDLDPEQAGAGVDDIVAAVDPAQQDALAVAAGDRVVGDRRRLGAVAQPHPAAGHHALLDPHVFALHVDGRQAAQHAVADPHERRVPRAHRRAGAAADRFVDRVGDQVVWCLRDRRRGGEHL